MLLVTAEQMRALDQKTIEGLGIPGLILMENAGRGVAQAILKHMPDEASRGIIVLAGPGNNGGDGFVAARHLYQKGIRIRIFLLAPGERFHGDARTNLEIIKSLGLPIDEILNEDQAKACEKSLRNCGLIVDAIFGTGLKRDVEGRFAAIIDIAKHSERPIVAVDIPSGLCADTGKPLGTCIRADLTVTMALPKTGHVTISGARHTGNLEVVDIGIPSFIVEQADIQAELMDEDIAGNILRPRPEWGHKGTFGHLLILSGSRGRTGAGALVAHGALRAGAGLVTLACPQSCQEIMATKLTEAMTEGLDETDAGTVSINARERIERLVQGKNAMALGPGTGLDPETMQLMRHLIKSVPLPMVVDADGLTAIGRDHSLVNSSKGQRILTPHPGEMSRLTGRSVQDIQSDRVEAARSLAKAARAWIVLKGAGTVIAAPDGRVSICTAGNPGMGAGGMGDVLTGIMAGMLAQGYEPWDAARAAVYAHARAADQVSRLNGPWGFTATEVADRLPGIWSQWSLRIQARGTSPP